MKPSHLFFFSLFLIVFFPESSAQKMGGGKADSGEFFFPEMTSGLKSILESLGTLNEFKSSNFILYYKKDSYSAKNLEKLSKLVDDAIERVEQVLKIDHITRGFYIVMLDTREEMKTIVGYKYKGISLGEDDAAIFVFNREIRPYFKHELFHLIAYHTWGRHQSRVLDEGGAMYTDNECLHYNNPLSTINKYLYQNKKWFSLDDLINSFNDKANENDMIAYLQSAYIFRHLYENYGKEKLLKLWNMGFSEFKNIYGIDIRALESNIIKKMKSIIYKDIDWDELMEKGCG